jgi:magnesium chelatase subunit I
MVQLPSTLGDLKKSSYQPRSVKQEIRENLIRVLKDRVDVFNGIIGYKDTVIPQLINALLARHNILLLGQRGQAKTRLIRCLTRLLDDAIPVIDGAPVPEDPMNPITPTGQRMANEAADDLPLAWLERSDRYQEKLATPDVSIADLIGDIDPIKAMNRKLEFSNEEIIHYGLIPRSNRCIFAINELSDLQPRIQVGLLNILEEQDFQVRGFPIRMQIDVDMVFTANPEDYTNRGNIITPLKDRIEAQILTHYPQSLEEGVAITRQEAWTVRNGESGSVISGLFYDLIEQITIEARLSDYVDRGSGVSTRMPITLLETLKSTMEQRSIQTSEEKSHARVCDLYTSIPAITGKVELVYRGEQEGVAQVAEHLVGKAVKERFNSLFTQNYRHGIDPKHDLTQLQPIINWFEGGQALDLDNTMNHTEYESRLNAVNGLRKLTIESFPGLTADEQPGAMEFILEGMAQNFILSKFKLVNGTRYADELYHLQTDDVRE